MAQRIKKEGLGDQLLRTPSFICPDCRIPCEEVRYIPGPLVGLTNRSRVRLYPKSSDYPPDKRQFHEFRFYCRSCQFEWIYSTLPKHPSEALRLDSAFGPTQFIYDPTTKLLKRNPDWK